MPMVEVQHDAPELEKVGLAAALQTRLKAVEARGGLQTELQVEGMEGGREIKQLQPHIWAVPDWQLFGPAS